jgi:hypothetical protein
LDDGLSVMIDGTCSVSRSENASGCIMTKIPTFERF